MATYFFSDPHFGHGNIMKYSDRLDFMTDQDYEAFQKLGNKARMSDESVSNMNEAIIGNINAVVQPTDHLYCLGDWCFSSRENYLRDARRYRDEIKCQNVHLIWGNHDQFSLRRSVDFASCMDLARVETEAGEYVICHYPMVGWDKSHRGVMHLYGHVHGLYSDPNKSPVAFPESWAAFDVGVDVEKRYGVWSAVELSQKLKSKVEAAKLRRD
jgi:calcineurin-like phosphoesterase family protein